MNFDNIFLKITENFDVDDIFLEDILTVSLQLSSALFLDYFDISQAFQPQKQCQFL